MLPLHSHAKNGESSRITASSLDAGASQLLRASRPATLRRALLAEAPPVGISTPPDVLDPAQPARGTMLCEKTAASRAPPSDSMLEQLHDVFDRLLGLSLEAKEINAGQMSLRAALVFLMAGAIIRMGNKRFMGKSTALDVMLGIIFGSVVSRAITGTAPFFPAMAAGATLVLFHWLISAGAFHSPRVGWWFKGEDRELVKNGVLNRQALQRSHITEADLHEALRRHGESPDITRIKSAHLERNGDISLLMS